MHDFQGVLNVDSDHAPAGIEVLSAALSKLKRHC
jgi:hypothetical protein